MVDQTERLARAILRAANRTQAKGSTVRLVFPREPEVLDEFGWGPTDVVLFSVVEYLEDHGYLAPANIGLIRKAYTITPAGFAWLEKAESTLRAELAAERRRREDAERERDDLRRRLEASRKPPREPRESPPTSTPAPQRGVEEPRPLPVGPQRRSVRGAVRRALWRRFFGG
jgi:hypothetical protein